MNDDQTNDATDEPQTTYVEPTLTPLGSLREAVASQVSF